MVEVITHDAEESRHLLELMECMLPVRFQHRAPSGLPLPPATPGRRFLRSTRGLELEVAAAAGDPAGTARLAAEIVFGTDLQVPFPYRGRTVDVSLIAGFTALAARPGERVLATTKDGEPLWTVEGSGDSARYRSAAPLPSCTERESFFDFFNGQVFLEGLVLLEFLRSAVAAQRLDPPPLRASFIIDDPNLHWPSYGHVDFAALAVRAREKHYHVGMATIPMDAWFVHARTADIFRRHRDALSLLVHGNNHSRDELSATRSAAARAALLGQAIRRIEVLERKSRLEVCRVMVPPHGACSAEMLAELPRHGFEAACISSGSLRAHNPVREWTRALGHGPAEFIEGCTVMPRWGIGGMRRGTLLAAAYLGQPMVIRGHQGDLKQGLEILDDVAGLINSLGAVEWSSMTRLSRMNYCSRIEGTTLRVRLSGRSADVPVHPSVAEIVVEAPPRTGFPHETRVISRRRREPGAAEVVRCGLAEAGAAAPLRGPGDAAQEDSTPGRMRFYMRRFATEARDRLLSF